MGWPFTKNIASISKVSKYGILMNCFCFCFHSFPSFKPFITWYRNTKQNNNSINNNNDVHNSDRITSVLQFKYCDLFRISESSISVIENGPFYHVYVMWELKARYHISPLSNGQMWSGTFHHSNNHDNGGWVIIGIFILSYNQYWCIHAFSILLCVWWGLHE